MRSSVTLSLTAPTRAPPCRPAAARVGAQHDLRRQAHGQPDERAWSRRTLTHSDDGSISCSTACRRRPWSRARHRGRRRRRRSARAGARRRAADGCPSARRRGAVDPTRGGEVGLRGGEMRPRPRPAPATVFQRAGADEILRGEVLVAARVERRQSRRARASCCCAAAAATARRRARWPHRAPARVRRGPPGPFCQQLAGPHRVAHLGGHRLGSRPATVGADQDAAPRLDRADAEQGGVMLPSLAVVMVTRVGASGPERSATMTRAASRARPSSASSHRLRVSGPGFTPRLRCRADTARRPGRRPGASPPAGRPASTASPGPG